MRKTGYSNLQTKAPEELDFNYDCCYSEKAAGTLLDFIFLT